MNTSLTPDEDLVAAVAAGDEAALAGLYDRHGGAAFRLAYGVIRDHQLAEDAVQEAFLAVWKHAGSYNPRAGSARTWMFMIIHRRAVDVIRKRERRPMLLVQDDRLLDVHTSGAAEDEALEREERYHIRSALADLAPNQRQTVELAYWGGFSQSEIATNLGVPLGTVKSRTFSGLSNLRTALDRDPAYA